jgi:hypothetical protein
MVITLDKKSFLADKEVAVFTAWLADKIECPSISNTYTDKDFNSLYDGYFQYNWSGNNFGEDKDELDRFKKSIKSTDPKEVLYGCIELLKWGKTEKVAIEVVELYYKNELVPYLQTASKILSQDKIELSGSLSMNSGWSKIYSLLLDDFIIYDGRVGAAIASLVKLKFGKNIPDELKFRTGEGYGSAVKRRTVEGFHQIPTSKKDRKIHLSCNIKANWLLKEVLNKNSSSKFGTDLKKLEAALFMFGYDVRNFTIKNL